jgi:hypothetical protein
LPRHGNYFTSSFTTKRDHYATTHERHDPSYKHKTAEFEPHEREQ